MRHASCIQVADIEVQGIRARQRLIISSEAFEAHLSFERYESFVIYDRSRFPIDPFYLWLNRADD
jgi:hypothetical protein